MELVKKDTTSKIVSVFLRDSTTGQGKTGVTAAAMSGGYTDNDNAAATALSFASGSVGDAYSSGKWAEVGNGEYYYHAPNGMFDQFGRVVATFRASGAIDKKLDFQVVAFDPDDLNSLGLARLDTAVSTRNAQTPLDAAGVRSAVGLASANLDSQFSAIPAAVWVNGSRTLSAFAFSVNLNADQSAVTIGTCNVNADMRGTDGAALASQWTAGRAAYIDNLSGGPVATQSSVDNIQNAVRSAFVTPKEYQLPAAGSVRFRIDLLIYARDTAVLEDPDSNAVTITVANAAGTSRSGNLYDASSGGTQTGTMNRDGVGRYHLFYEIDSADPEEQLNFLASYAENGQSLADRQSTVLVATATGGGFNTSDRSFLTTLYNEWADGGRLDLLLDARATSTEITALQSNLSTYLDASIASAHAATVATVVGNDNTNAGLLNSAIQTAQSDLDKLTGADGATLASSQPNYAPATVADLATVDGKVSAVQTIADKLDTTLEDDGSGGSQFTTLALENAPAGGGGGNVTVEDFTQAALAKFATTDTGETSAADGSVAKIAQGAAGGNVTVDTFTANALNQLAAQEITVQNPYTEETQTLTLVQRADYTSDSAAGPLRFELTAANVAKDDVVRFGATLPGGDSIAATGAVVDIAGTLYAEIELTAATHTDVAATNRGHFELEHVSGTGKVSPLLVDCPLVVLPSHAEA